MKTKMSGIFMYITLCSIIQDTESFPQGALGGPCISHTQRQCQDESTDLWIARDEHKMDQICGLFKLYQNCIVSHMSVCNFRDDEKELHQADIVKHFVDPPYNCPFPEKSIGIAKTKKAQGQKSNSSLHVSNSVILCVSILLQKIISLFTLYTFGLS